MLLLEEVFPFFQGESESVKHFVGLISYILL